jgi:hypothetical protein
MLAGSDFGLIKPVRLWTGRRPILVSRASTSSTCDLILPVLIHTSVSSTLKPKRGRGVAGNEDYRKNPSRDLIEILIDCAWQYVGPGLWEKGRSRLLVDSIGCFFYQYRDGRWHRLAGLSHQHMTQLDERIIHFGPAYYLDLLEENDNGLQL